MAGRVLLIHGAWQGAWVWEALTPHLLQAGFEVDAPDLPGNGADGLDPREASLERYVDFLSARLDGAPGPVVVIGHSGGGVVASQLAEARPDKVAGLVYLAGMMLPSGMPYADLASALIAEGVEASGIWPYLAWSDDGLVSCVPAEAAADIFLHDAPRDLALEAGRRLTPQGERGRHLIAALTPERFGGIPRLYVEALEDRSLVLAAQRRMQALTPGAEVVSLRTGHAPHVSAPERTAQAILPALKRWLAPG
ncbi:MAG TPA: alpha/beta fold hydrolase [Caulobacteraceae bacterium]|nr:alpha/beta fold hydrolase [Caulobacteraceae bacterium]